MARHWMSTAMDIGTSHRWDDRQTAPRHQVAEPRTAGFHPEDLAGELGRCLVNVTGKGSMHCDLHITTTVHFIIVVDTIRDYILQ